VIVFVHDLYDGLVDTLLSGEVGDGSLELIEVGWSFDALE